MTTTRVLLIEDNEDTATLTRQHLQTQGEFDMAWADTLATAQRIVTRQAFDIVLLDFSLPDADGLQALRKLQSMGVDAPVVMITGRGDEQIAVQCVKAGAVDYIVKGGGYMAHLGETVLRTLQQHTLRRAVSEAESRYRHLFEQASDGILVCEVDGGILDANRHACEWLQVSRYDLIGRNIAEFERPEAGTSDDLRAALTREDELVYEVQFARQDGSLFPAEVSARQVRQGTTVFQQYFIRNIEHRKQMEREILQRSRELAALSEITAAVNRSLKFNEVLRAALTGVMDALEADGGAIFLADASGLELAVSKGLSEAFLNTTADLPHEAFAGFEDAPHTGDVPAWLAGENLSDFVIVPLIHKATLLGYLVLGVRGVAAFTDDQTGFVRVNCDRIAVAIENARLMAELRESVEATRVAQAQLVRAARLSAVGELSAGVAHQINNPLTTVIADAQLLTKTLDKAHPAYESAEAIYQAGWRAQRVVQQLLNFARPADEELGPTHINDTIMGALALLGPYLERSGVLLQTALETRLPQLQANGHQLEELWINLLLNARDAVSQANPGVIEIRSQLSDDSETIVVSLSDNGAGIPADALDSVFEPFFTTRRDSGGTGLGLSVCMTIAQQHGGYIRASNRPGGGAQFTVYLPLRGGQPTRPSVRSILQA